MLWCVAELIDLPFLLLVFRRWLRADARDAAQVDAVLEAERALARGRVDRHRAPGRARRRARRPLVDQRSGDAQRLRRLVTQPVRRRVNTPCRRRPVQRVDRDRGRRRERAVDVRERRARCRSCPRPRSVGVHAAGSSSTTTSSGASR